MVGVGLGGGRIYRGLPIAGETGRQQLRAVIKKKTKHFSCNLSMESWIISRASPRKVSDQRGTCSVEKPVRGRPVSVVMALSYLASSAAFESAREGKPSIIR